MMYRFVCSISLKSMIDGGWVILPCEPSSSPVLDRSVLGTGGYIFRRWVTSESLPRLRWLAQPNNPEWNVEAV